jgi:hypothetical protein
MAVMCWQCQHFCPQVEAVNIDVVENVGHGAIDLLVQVCGGW